MRESIEPSASENPKTKALFAVFDQLDHLPEGIKPSDYEAMLANTYMGNQMFAYFAQHGVPEPIDFFLVTKTLASVFLGEFARAKREWEKARNQIKDSER